MQSEGLQRLRRGENYCEGLLPPWPFFHSSSYNACAGAIEAASQQGFDLCVAEARLQRLRRGARSCEDDGEGVILLPKKSLIRAKGGVVITFTVYGRPQPAGSKRGFPIKRANGSIGVAISDDNPKSRDWKNAVASAAREVYHGDLLRGPLLLKLTFHRPRPGGHFGATGLNKKGRETEHPVSKPDLLKLARGVEDALTGIVWADDAQIVEEVLSKQWGEPSRVEIEICLTL